MSLPFDKVVNTLGKPPRDPNIIDAAQIAWCPARYIVGRQRVQSPLFDTLSGLLNGTGYSTNEDVCATYGGLLICGVVDAIRETPTYVDALLILSDEEYQRLNDMLNYASVIKWVLTNKYKAPVYLRMLAYVKNVLVVIGNPPLIPDVFVAKNMTALPVMIDIPTIDEKAIELMVGMYQKHREAGLLPVKPGSYCSTCPLAKICAAQDVKPITKEVQNIKYSEVSVIEVDPNNITRDKIQEIVMAVRLKGRVTIRIRDEDWDKINQLYKMLREYGITLVYNIQNATLEATLAKKKKPATNESE